MLNIQRVHIGCQDIMGINGYTKWELNQQTSMDTIGRISQIYAGYSHEQLE
jgi:hypothetical protein